MRVSHESIYASLYLQGKGGLKRELIAALRSGGRLHRRPRRRGEKARRANVLGDITPLNSPRPAADRAFPGHWEGDLIMGAFNRSALVTVVERRSRFLLLGDLPEGHDAQAVHACLIELTADLPDGLHRSLTWDQGREMASWPKLQPDADIEVFFCDPHSPWQRPSNEHMNGVAAPVLPEGHGSSIGRCTVSVMMSGAVDQHRPNGDHTMPGALLSLAEREESQRRADRRPFPAVGGNRSSPRPPPPRGRGQRRADLLPPSRRRARSEWSLRRPRERVLARRGPLRDRVTAELKLGRSPEAIWADLVAEQVEPAVSVETIYAAFFASLAAILVGARVVGLLGVVVTIAGVVPIEQRMRERVPGRR